MSHDRLEQVVVLDDMPASSVGAPMPRVLANEHTLMLAYLMADEPGGDSDGEELVAMVTFERPTVHLFGPPNDEVFSSHRLAGQGLQPYRAHEVRNSRWIDALEKANAIHPRHDRARYLDGKRHFIVSFHDSTFECIAKGYAARTVPAQEARTAAMALFDDAFR